MNLYKKYLVKVQLVREKAAKKLVSSPAEVLKLVKVEMEKFDREYLISIYLDAANQVVAIEECSKGTLNAAPISSREVYKAGILCNAMSLIILQNHPSGECKPSEDDIKVTKMLSDAGEILGIKLLDHIIVGANDTYMSFKERGLIQG